MELRDNELFLKKYKFLYGGIRRPYSEPMVSEIVRSGKVGHRIAIVTPDKKIFRKIVSIEEYK